MTNRLLKRKDKKTVVSSLTSNGDKRSEVTRLTVTVTQGDVDDLEKFVKGINESEQLSQRVSKSSVVRSALRSLYKQKNPISKLY